MTDAERAEAVEVMAKASNRNTDGHERYWTGYVPSANAALTALLAAGFTVKKESGNG